MKYCVFFCHLIVFSAGIVAVALERRTRLGLDRNINIHKKKVTDNSNFDDLFGRNQSKHAGYEAEMKYNSEKNILEASFPKTQPQHRW